MNSKSEARRVLKLDPSNLTANVWGGHWIPRLKKIRVPSYPVGESWEFSTHPDHRARVQGPKKTFLSNLVHGPSFLLKILDAQDHLSVQVHPDDRTARRLAGQNGKTETWIILERNPGRDKGFIYLGFRPGTVDLRKKLVTALATGSERKILPLLNRVRVRPGEVYHVPAGTIHAIGAGLRLAEIQQSSNVTYRIWDWNRVPARSLHHKESFGVLSFRTRPISFYRKAPRPVTRRAAVREESLIRESKAGYAMNRITWPQRGGLWTQVVCDRFFVLTGVAGRAALMLGGKKVAVVQPGHTCVVLKGRTPFQLKSLTPGAVVLKSFIP